MAQFEDLTVWKDAHAIALQVYDLTKRLPPHEQYGLVSQMRRAAVSIPANIVEGQERQGPKDFQRFMDIALGSAAELRYFLILIRDLAYLTEADTSPLAAKLAGLSRMLRTFRSSRE
jgi:four helix bundle protein